MVTTILRLISNVNLLDQIQRDFSSSLQPTLMNNEQSIQNLESTLGTKPPFFFKQFDAPSLWTSVGLIGSEVVDISNRMNHHGSNFSKETIVQLSRDVEKLQDSKIQDCHDRIELQKKSLISIATQLKELVESRNDQLKSRIKKRCDSVNSQGSEDDASARSGSSMSISDSDPDDNFDTLLRSFKHDKRPLKTKSPQSWRERIEQEMAQIRSFNDASSIQFCSLGLKSRLDSDAWLTVNSPGEEFGYIVDVHTICEHLFVQLYCKESTLGNLHNLAKLKLKTDVEGISVTSFDVQVPKLFVKNPNFKVIRKDGSYFDTVQSYNDWNTTDDGFRDTILQELKEFMSNHLSLVDPISKKGLFFTRLLLLLLLSLFLGSKN